MLQDSDETKLKWHPRIYEIYLIILLILLVVILSLSFFVFHLPISTSFDVASWAEMSLTMGTSVVTLVAIIIAIGLSNENEKRLNFNEILDNQSNKIEEKRRNNPDRTNDRIYDASKEKIQKVMDSVPLLRYRESLLGIISFIFFLVSALLAIMNASFEAALTSFSLAAILLVGYVVYVIEEFANMDKYSRARKKNGSLEILDIRVNNNHQRFEVKNKSAKLSSGKLIERIELKVRVSGHIRNGFLHATVKYRNNWISYIPDSNTFLASFGFIDDYHLILLEKFDTGILQIEDSVELTFEIPIRVAKQTDDNPLIAEGHVENLGNKKIYKHCSIPDNILINAVEIRIWEDPLFRPNFKRRELDCITLQIAEQTFTQASETP